MSLKGRLTGESPPAADLAFTCAHYDPKPGGKRCRHYLENGACDRPDELMCVEWLKANGQTSGESKATPPAKQAPDDDADRDLFGTPIPPRKEPEQKEAASTTVRDQPPQTPTPILVRDVTDEEIASFKALGAEVCLASEELGEVWLVPEYTDQDRKELSVEHSATLTAICAAFPGAKVISFEKLPPKSEDE